MLKTESKRIGVHTYKVTQLDAVTGRKVFARLVRIAGPALGAAHSSDKKEGAFLEKLAAAITEDDFEYFCDLFSVQTAVGGGSYKGEPQLDKVFDMHFAGNYGDMLQWLVFCLTVNFGSFFAEAGSLLGAKPAAEESPSS